MNTWSIPKDSIPLETEPSFPKRLPSIDVIATDFSLIISQQYIQMTSNIELSLQQAIELQKILDQWIEEKNEQSTSSNRSHKKKRLERAA